MRKAFFLTSGRPVPIVGARRIRDAQIITLLAKRIPVEVLCVSEQNDTPAIQASVDAAFGPNVSVSCHPLDHGNPVIAALDYIRPHFAKGYSHSIESTLRSKAKPGDIIWLSRLRMGKYMSLARKLGCFSILDEHQIESDLLFDNAFTQMRFWHQGLTAAQCALYEKKLSYAADLVVTASPIDASRMEKLAPNSKCQVLPYGIDTKIYSAPADPNRTKAVGAMRLSFIADLDYRPNQHALEWIRDELLPRLVGALKEDRPTIQIHCQSSNVQGLAAKFPEFVFRGYTRNEELIDQLRDSIAAVFPLRYGRGNRIHILEAIATGVPVVTTGRGADGLFLKPLADVCIAERPDEFASLVMRIARDPAFRSAIVESGRKAVQARYDWSQSTSAMDSIFTKLGINELPASSACASTP
jgi:glycosyltransferase involved in cell wall biosynthesis